jgi:hypothetical protein
MLTSITPLGERSKGNRFRSTATAYVVGSLVGGVALGLLGAAVGVALRAVVGPTAAAVVLGVVCLAAAAGDLAGIRPPSWHRQVDEQWLQAFRGWVYGAGFGVQLGFGLVTIVTSWSTYAVVAAVVLAPSAGWSVLVGATFGLARGLVLLSARRVRSPEALARLHGRIAAGAGAARTATVATLVVAGAVTVLGVTA